MKNSDSKYIVSDINNGLAYLKVGILNLIDDIISSCNGSYKFKHISLSLIKECVKIRKLKFIKFKDYYIIKDELNNNLIKVETENDGTVKFESLIS